MPQGEQAVTQRTADLLKVTRLKRRSAFAGLRLLVVKPALRDLFEPLGALRKPLPNSVVRCVLLTGGNRGQQLIAGIVAGGRTVRGPASQQAERISSSGA